MSRRKKKKPEQKKKTPNGQWIFGMIILGLIGAGIYNRIQPEAPSNPPPPQHTKPTTPLSKGSPTESKVNSTGPVQAPSLDPKLIDQFPGDQKFEYDPDKAYEHLDRGNLLFSEQKIAEAGREYALASKYDTEEEESLFNLGICFSRLGNLDKAIEYYEKTLELVPDYPEVLNNLGNAIMRKGDTHLAVKKFEEALNILPNYPKALNNLGKAKSILRLEGEAMENFEKAVEIESDYFDARFNLAISYLKLRRPEDAVIEFQILLEKKPQFAPLKTWLEKAEKLVEIKKQEETKKNANP